MAGHHHGLSVRGGTGERVDHLVGMVAIELRGRLVSEQHHGRHRGGHRDRQPLLLAAAEVRRARPRTLAQPVPLERGGHRERHCLAATCLERERDLLLGA